MRYLLCSVLMLCQAGLLGPVARAAGPAMPAGGNAASAAMCTSAAPLDALIASSFPAMPPAEGDFAASGPDSDEYAAYRYESHSEFACFPAQAPGAGRGGLQRGQWLASTRLLPAYPHSPEFLFLPLGWQWIDFIP